MQLVIIFTLYQVIQLLALPVLIIYAISRKLKKKPAVGNLKERLGFIHKSELKPILKLTNPFEVSLSNHTNVIWIHAVSVGEILSIQNLIDQIKKNIPNSFCYVTTGTTTGKKIALENLNCDHVSFLPFDFLPSMLLAFKRIKPSSVIILEAEIWPNFLILTKWLKVPTYSLNARISERSKPRYQKFKFIFTPLFNIFKRILVQSQQDKINFENLGVNPQKLSILGNIKALNVLVKKEKLPKQDLSKAPFQTLLIGSIHPGELDIYLDMFKELKHNFTNLKLILAPRHFNWKNELINKVKSSKFNYYLWEKESPDLNTIFNTNDILVVCRLGELFKLYQLSNIFFLGGTFVPIGGHNLLEPAVWSKPSIIGPYYHNCKDIADKLEKENALIKAKDPKELLLQTQKLLNNSKLEKQMGQSANAWLEKEASFVQENIEQLLIKLKSQ